MRLTKNDLARTIVQALYNMPALPATDYGEVVKRVRNGTVDSLTAQYTLALKALASVSKKAEAARAMGDAFSQFGNTSHPHGGVEVLVFRTAKEAASAMRGGLTTPHDGSVPQWAKDMTELVLGKAPFKIGDHVLHPNGYVVEITDGQYWGTHGLSNFWYWRRVQPDGQLSVEREHGYGWNPVEPPERARDTA